jgi:large subunit ribosomal protein L9
MKVILLEEVQGKGGEGDVVDVARGYANNYLLPKGLAIAATKGNLKQLEARRHNIERRELARTTDATTLQEAIGGKVVTIAAKVGDEGQLFGSVTPVAISEAIAAQIGPEIDRKKIEVVKAIKTVGDHEAQVNLYRDIKAVFTVRVVDEKAPVGEPEQVDETAQAETAEEVVAEAGEVVEETAEVAGETAE